MEGVNIDYTTLYIRDNTGALREWSIGAENSIIYIQYGQVGGSIQIKTEKVETGKAGRTIREQIMLRMASRISRQLDNGYSYDKEYALKTKGVNKLGLKKPMLAHKIQDHKPDWDNAYVQYKYDGHRCMVTKQNDELIAYTRRGKILTAIEHILNCIDIEEGMTLDGELYCHGMTLQQISSAVKRINPTEITKQIRYHIYDIMEDMPYPERLDILQSLKPMEFAEVVPTEIVDENYPLEIELEKAKLIGYEGLIIRNGCHGYESGKRSSQLLKVKKFMDAEFTVVKIYPSADDWAILECETEEGMLFSVSAPGTIYQKEHTWMQRENYIGKRVVVEFANWTKDGKPFHPVAQRWYHEDEEI